MIVFMIPYNIEHTVILGTFVIEEIIESVLTGSRHVRECHSRIKVFSKTPDLANISSKNQDISAWKSLASPLKMQIAAIVYFHVSLPVCRDIYLR
jgi:hypothetical protein